LQYGFGLVRGPEELTHTLQTEIRGGIERGETREEHAILAIEGEKCLFIDRPDLTDKVSSEPERGEKNPHSLLVFCDPNGC